MSIRGRINFLQLARYGKYKEQRYRQQFEKLFDFLSFNKEVTCIFSRKTDTHSCGKRTAILVESGHGFLLKADISRLIFSNRCVLPLPVEPWIYSIPPCNLRIIEPCPVITPTKIQRTKILNIIYIISLPDL